MRKGFVLITLLFFLVSLSLQTNAYSQTKVKPITLQGSAGGVGGVWYIVFAGIAELIKEKAPEIQIKVVPGGGLINPPRVGKGDVQMAILFAPQAAATYHGMDPFKEKTPDIRMIAGGFGNNYVQFVVAEETGLTSFEDLIKKKYPLKIAVERKGTTDEWTLSLALSYYKLGYEDIGKWGGKVTNTGYSDQATMMKDRHVDALWENIAIPAPAIQDSLLSRKIKLLPLPEEVIKWMVEKYSLARGEIPVGSYGVVDKPLVTVLHITSIAVHAEVPEDVVYTITKVLCENPDRVREIHASARGFDPKVAWRDLGAPLHKGAERYYREKGYMK
ncbi:MAG: TAXI family TRAP transporter solute-binding subunit [Pseudomonadota bacterium]